VAVVAEVDEHTWSIQYTDFMTGVIGIDEVGRGPLAGPVTVCACFIEDDAEVKKMLFQNRIRDSKKVTKSLRNNIFQTIRQKRLIQSRLEYAVASKPAAYIDKYGIVPAIDACIESCLRQLKLQGVPIEKTPIRLDGGLKVKHFEALQSTHIKGDEQFVEIAVASIIAKVSRDSYMDRLGKRLKGYKWEENAGYGTKFHREAISALGITKYHRRTYLKGFKQFEKADR
jgi:ribonuclease HII